MKWHWIGKIWLKFDEKSFQKYLILDQCKVHLLQSVKELLKNNGTNYDYVPSGCTSLAQPLDTYNNNKPFKDKVRNYFEDLFPAKAAKKQIK